MSALLERNAAFITSPRGFSLFIIILLSSLGIMRAYLFPGVGGDDGEQLVFSQFFSWGYQVRNPPLVTWLLMGIQWVTGPTVFSIVALRTAILIGIYLLSLTIGLRLFEDKRLAALSAGSLLMIFYMGWNTIHGFTHTSLVTLFYLCALFLILRIRDEPSKRDLLALGLVFGFGLLAKYSFLIFGLALVFAAVLDQRLRGHLKSPWPILGFAVTLTLLVPQLQWLIEHAPAGHLITADPEYSVGDVILQKAKGILRVVPAIITFLLPLWIIWLGIFWKPVRQGSAAPSGSEPVLKLLQRVLIFLLAAAVIAILLIQSDRLRGHYLFVLIPLVPYFFLRFGHTFETIHIQRFAAVISLSGIALIGTLTGKYFTEPMVCGHCEDHIPYDEFADQLREAGFVQGTIFAYFHKDPLAGNLRVRFPNSRVVSAKHPAVIAPSKHPSGQCLIIWPVKGAREPKSATILTARNSALKLGIPFTHPSKVLTATLPPWRRVPHQLEYILLAQGDGECR